MADDRLSENNPSLNHADKNLTDEAQREQIQEQLAELKSACEWLAHKALPKAQPRDSTA